MAHIIMGQAVSGRFGTTSAPTEENAVLFPVELPLINMREKRRITL